MAAQKLLGSFDLTIIGGGIVGLATARAVTIRYPKLKVCVLEKEPELALHQSKRNSGVVHRGIYYKKNTLKSKYCIRGAKLIKQYCESKNLPYKQCGKLIVAQEPTDQVVLQDLYDNARNSDVANISLLSNKQIKQIQPNCTSSTLAIWSPETAIVDWRRVALSYADDFKENGGTIMTNYCANTFEPSNRSILITEARNKSTRIETKSVINCAGLYNDVFVTQTGNNPSPNVVPFKGDYYFLDDKIASTIKTNIYPVPDPKLPFLGIHITPRVDGKVLIGPNAMLSLNYENYDDTTFNPIATFKILFHSNLRKMVFKKTYFKAGVLEFWRSKSKKRFLNEARKLLPDLKQSDLLDTEFRGIRAQMVGPRGNLVDDFLFETGVYADYRKVLHLRNLPSPAATSSLAIAERVVQLLEEGIIN